MEPLKNATQEANRQSTGFVLANNQPCKISEQARKKGLQAANDLFSFGNIDIVDELISVKRKAYTDPKKSSKKKKLVIMPKVDLETLSDWEHEEDEDIEWSDCDADLSRTVEDLDKSFRDKSSEENSLRSD